jgi:glyoxylase-like metal-dependent hydrolase (beta-lactamase superfamily II)
VSTTPYAFITVEQAGALSDWVATSGKNLTTIYATHGHGDHFFSASTVLERFPRARFLAIPAVIRVVDCALRQVRLAPGQLTKREGYRVSQRT